MAIFKGSAAGGGRFIPIKPVISHTSYGNFLIVNYDSNINYSITVNSGNSSRVNNNISLSSTDVTATIIASSAKGGVSQSTLFERKSYTYYYTQSQSCTPNCRIAYQLPGGGYSCQGDGSPGADGSICCGGSAGSTCTTVTNGPYKNSTPVGYTDDNSEWWRSV